MESRRNGPQLSSRHDDDDDDDDLQVISVWPVECRKPILLYDASKLGRLVISCQRTTLACRH